MSKSKAKSKRTKTIIVLSDGTGNAVGKVWGTNVWRLYESLDLSGDDHVARYDEGVGSSNFLPLATIGGVFGFGLKRNVLDLYKFVSRNAHKEDVEISLFGFSLGAFTARVLAELIVSQGLINYDAPSSVNRKDRLHTVSTLDKLMLGQCHLATIQNRFPLRSVVLWDKAAAHETRDHSENSILGVWDTVGAYRFLFDGMCDAFDAFVWPLNLLSEKMYPQIKRAVQALSPDEERKPSGLFYSSKRDEGLLAAND